MILLQKLPEPQVLADNAPHWTQILLAHEAAGTVPPDRDKGRYNHIDIKNVLIAETAGKCAYCESKFGHIAYGDIEHITPKKNGAKYSFLWENLTVACDRCNTNKGVKDFILDPYEMDPEALFRPAGPMLLPRPESDAAMATERELRLNRTDLIERRSERIKRLHDIVMLAQRCTGAARQAIIDDLKDNETHNGVEFAAISRAYVAGLQAEGII